MGPMTLWKRQNRSGDLLGPNCLRGPLFSFASVKQLRYTDINTDTHGCVTALQSYTAIHRYTVYNLYNTPLILSFAQTPVARCVFFLEELWFLLVQVVYELFVRASRRTSQSRHLFFSTPEIPRACMHVRTSRNLLKRSTF